MQNFQSVTDHRRIGTNFLFQGFRYESIASFNSF